MPATRSVAQILRRLLAVALSAAGCAAVLSACGSSGSPGTGSSSNGQSNGLRFAECMRSHGVANFPDPGSTGSIQIGSGINPQSPAFRSAQDTCEKLLPLKQGRGGSSESRRLELLALAECMRAHGVGGFPDPSNGQPTAPPSGGGVAFGGPGGFISIPESMIQSPAFKHAASVCKFPGFGPGQKRPESL